MQSEIHLACALSFLHGYKYFILKWKFNANNFTMENAAVFVFLYDKPYAIHIRFLWKYNSVCKCKSYVFFKCSKIFVRSPKDFSQSFGHDTSTYENYNFCKKKISFSNFLCWSQGEFICVFVLSRGGYIAQWHRSTQVVQHSRDGQSAEQRQPPHQQTDGWGGAWKAPGTLQWKVGPENVSHLIPSERCLLRNFTWAWRIFTQF